MPPEISIVIPTYNRKEILKREIKSILAGSIQAERIEIIVVDDASSDGTSDIHNDFSNLKIIRNVEERGPAGCRNLGIQHAKGAFILILDDDNVVDEDCLENLLFAMESNQDIGIAAPAMYYYKSPDRIWCMGIERNRLTSITKFLYRDASPDGRIIPGIVESEDFPNSFMIRRALIEKIGLFDEKTFPIHYEEADFGERARRAGFRVVCITRARIWHDISLPEETDKARLLHCHNEFRAFYSGRNRIIFHKKYSKRWEFLIFIALCNWLISLYYLKAIMRTDYPIHSRIKIARAYLNGIWRGLVDH